jgi:CRP/FNR family nitrogen fixation transcriptional regulator
VTTQRLNIDPSTATPAPIGDASIISFGVRMRFAAGEEIYAQEDEADLVYQVATGAVRTTRLSSDGRRHIGDFYYPGDVFGVEAGPEHRYSAEALGDCEVQFVKRAALRHYGAEGERLERIIWEATAQQLARTQDHLMLLGRKSACEKVASFLLDIADRFSGDLTTLPMGRQDMADYLGLTIETVSRMLTQLQADGLVEFPTSRRFRVLRRGALARIAAG